MTDSYHFHIEPEPRVEAPNFRVGGVYRDEEGDTIRLCAENGRIGGLFLNDGGWGYHGGFFDLATGECEYGWCNLIPGELIERDGQWVAADAPIVFPSGAAVLTSGDKIVGRVEASHEQRIGNRLLTTDELHDALRVVLDSLYAAPKTQRDPLPDSDVWRGIGHKAHDTFGPDFIVTKGAVEVTPTPSPTTQGAYPATAGLLRG